MDALPLEEPALSNEVVLAAHEIDIPHRDAPDRLLLASDRVFDLTLLTVERRLQGSRAAQMRSR